LNKNPAVSAKIPQFFLKKTDYNPTKGETLTSTLVYGSGFFLTMENIPIEEKNKKKKGKKLIFILPNGGNFVPLQPEHN